MSNFKNKVVYEAYIKSFFDSNHDGKGDLRGVIEKLDYIKDIGVNSLWLTPFFESPMKDEGYDISAYKKVNPEFGTLEDVKELIKKANEKGIDIMADFVLNHTSSKHEWFQKALAGDEYYQKFYFFEDEPKTEWIPRFRGESCWEYVPSLNKYYLHLYDVSQPDLNWDNENLRKEMFEVVDFWLQHGIKAYKFDVLYLISKPVHNNWKPSGKIPAAEAVGDGKFVHQYIKELMKKIKDKYPDTYSVGEMSFSSIEECIKYSNPDSKEVDIVMTGKLLEAFPEGTDDSLINKPLPDMSIYIKKIKEWLSQVSKGNGQLCTFTANHDSPRSVNKFGSIKHWNESSKMLIAHSIAMWGIPFFTQGDEIGMMNPGYEDLNDYVDIKSQTLINSEEGKSIDKKVLIKSLDDNGRDPGRNPMIWDNTKNGGWSSSDKPWRKTMDWLKDKVNVESQLKDKDSILNFFKKAVSLRKSNITLQEGNITFLDNDPFILDFIREFKDEKLRCIFNFSDENKKIENIDSNVSVLLSNYNLDKIENKQELMPWEGIIFKK